MRRVKGWAVHARAVIGRGTSAQGFYARALRYGDLAFDIGALHGAHTAAMLKRGARVVAAEPQARFARHLARAHPTATVLTVGLSDTPGEGRLLTSNSGPAMASMNRASVDDPLLGEATWDGEETIRLTTLDEL